MFCEPYQSNLFMYYVLSKDIIESEIICHLPVRKRGFKPQAPTCEIINCILYKLKTGIQWHLLPVDSLFSTHVLHYKTIFGHYRRWCKEGIWKKCWIELLKKYKSSFDLSMVNLYGSHSSCIRGGEEVAYQGRKKRKTTNALYLTDKQGLVLAMSTPVSGNHNDLFNIEQTFEELTTMLEDATISVDGLFMNADAGFDAENLHQLCHQKQIIANIAPNKRNTNDDNRSRIIDEELYKERFSIERTNA